MMDFVKRGMVVSVAAAGLIVGSAGLASADTGDHGDGDNTNVENNSLIEDVLNGNVVQDNLSGNNVVINDVLGGGLLD